MLYSYIAGVSIPPSCCLGQEEAESDPLIQVSCQKFTAAVNCKQISRYYRLESKYCDTLTAYRMSPKNLKKLNLYLSTCLKYYWMSNKHFVASIRVYTVCICLLSQYLVYYSNNRKKKQHYFSLLHFQQ